MKNLMRLMLALTTIVCLNAYAISQHSWSIPILIDTASIIPASYDGGQIAFDDSGTIYTAYNSKAESIFVARSTDNGYTWNKYVYASGVEPFRAPKGIVVDHQGNVYLLWLSTEGKDFSPYYLNLSKSVDSGRTFTTLFSSLAWGDGFFDEKLAVDNQNRIYVLWDDQQFKLTRFRFGDTTERFDAEIPNDTLTFGYNTCLMITKDYVVHCLWEGSYFDSTNNLHEYVYYSRSNDTGITFQGRLRVDTTTSTSIYYDAYHYPSLAVDSTGFVFVSYTKETQLNDREIRIARSTINGQSFNSPVVISGSDTAYTSKLCVDSQNGISILWGSQGHGIRHYRSNDGGLSFTFFAPFTHIGFLDFKAGRNGLLYATGANDSGFGFSQTSVVLSICEHEFHPFTFHLLPNYPNPFNPTTIIPFSIPQLDEINLKVYDMTGREITVLLSKRLAPGSYSVEWQGAGFASGVYLVRLIAGGNFIATRKMILLK